MRRSLLEILIDPVSGESLQIEERPSTSTSDVIEGTLRSAGRSYPITNGIPRFVLTEDADQKQTEQSFGYKWQQRNTYDSPQIHANSGRWVTERYGFKSIEEMRDFFGNRKRILDAGCGNGFSSSLWMDSSFEAEWVGADISIAIDVAQERLGHINGTQFVQADILQLPFAKNSFDTVFTEGVIHHTPSAESAFKSLVSVLAPGGEIMCYIYRKKAPIREFTDDHIRNVVSSMPPQQAWEALRPLTKLGQALAEMNAEIEVPEDIPYLGIKAGRYDVQRLIYWHVGKMFWNPDFSFEENNHVNFDWYHPRYAHRYTEEELRRWCAEADLSVVHFDAQESGFTVRAQKKA